MTIKNSPPYPPGSITATPARLKRKLGIQVMKVRGVSSRRRGRK